MIDEEEFRNWKDAQFPVTSDLSSSRYECVSTRPQGVKFVLLHVHAILPGNEERAPIRA